MDLELGGRSVLVTGGSKGIGLAIAKAFASEGCRLRLVARSGNQLEQAAALIREAHPVEVRTSALDLSDAAARDRFVAGCGETDILVNNAGSSANAGLMALTRALGSTSVDAGVRVVGVNPGPVDSDRLESLVKRRAKSRFGDENRWREIYGNMPFGRPATPEEIAATVVFLGSDLSSYTSGAIFTVDGGLAARSATP